MPLSEMIWMQKHTPWQIYQIYCRSIQVYTQKKFSKCIKKYAEICIMYAEICIMYAEKCRSIQFLLIPAPIFLQRVLNLYVMPHIKSLCNATSCPCPPGSDCQFANCSFCRSGESIYDLPLWSLCPMCWCFKSEQFSENKQRPSHCLAGCEMRCLHSGLCCLLLPIVWSLQWLAPRAICLLYPP